VKHWKPDGEAVPLRPTRARRHWTSLTDYAPPRPRPQAHEMRPATMVGLALVAAACLVAAIGANAVLSPPQAVDRAAVS